MDIVIRESCKLKEIDSINFNTNLSCVWLFFELMICSIMVPCLWVCATTNSKVLSCYFSQLDIIVFTVLYRGNDASSFVASVSINKAFSSPINKNINELRNLCIYFVLKPMYFHCISQLV